MAVCVHNLVVSITTIWHSMLAKWYQLYGLRFREGPFDIWSKELELVGFNFCFLWNCWCKRTDLYNFLSRKKSHATLCGWNCSPWKRIIRKFGNPPTQRICMRASEFQTEIFGRSHWMCEIFTPLISNMPAPEEYEICWLCVS